MRKTMDPLYSIFEQHLFTALVEDESTEEFLIRVVTDYVGRMMTSGTVIPAHVRTELETDLKEEVLEMLRKKTYGHFNLNAFRRAKGIEVSSPLLDAVPAGEKEKARRAGRAS